MRRLFGWFLLILGGFVAFVIWGLGKVAGFFRVGRMDDRHADPRLVLDDLFRILGAVAPERAADLSEILEAVNPQLSLEHEETRHPFRATPELNLIRVGLPCL